MIRAPKQLTGLALAEWKRVAPDLISSGVLTLADIADLAFYCVTYARWQDAEDQVSREGILFRTQKGNLISHPALGVANTAMKLCHKFASEFGLTPRARARLMKTSAGDGADAPPGLEE